MKTRVILLSTICSFFVFNSCTTSKKEPLKLMRFDQINPFSLSEFEFTKNDQVILNAAVLKKELKSGVKINLKTTHTAKGVIQCFYDGIGETCYVRAELPDSPYYGSTSPLPADLTKRLASHYRKSRQDLLRDRIITATFGCDYISEKMTKGSNSDDLSCFLLQPRRTSEEILMTGVATDIYRKISRQLKKELISSELLNNSRIDGLLECLSLDDEKKQECRVFSEEGFKSYKIMLNDEKTNKPSEEMFFEKIDSKITVDLKRKLFVRYGEYRTSTQQKNSKNYQDPNLLTLRFNCLKNRNQPNCILFF